MTYQVYVIKSFDEPWWLTSEWDRADVITKKDFTEEDAAITFYLQQVAKMKPSYERIKTREEIFTALWNPGEVAYCVPCENDEQLYLGIFIYIDENKPSSQQIQALKAKLDGVEM